MADHVQEILNDYTNDNAGTKTSGKLAGTGKLVILPVDQGFEPGPARGFGPNPPGLRSAVPFPTGYGRRMQCLRCPAGRHSFQRPKMEAVKFLQTIMGIYAGDIP
jgi:fructose-bisphosphate aldolase, class I